MKRTLRILYLEPFDGGSHRSFTRALTALDAEWTLLTLPGRHWKWRMRGAVPYWIRAEAETLARPYDVIFASSFVPLHELYGLAPNLVATPSVLYFHENQLTYPTRPEHDRGRDFDYGFTQLLAGLAADRIVFNSAHNRDSLMEAARTLLRRLPGPTPPGWIEALEAKSSVLGLPLALPRLDDAVFTRAHRSPAPLLLWNHRWEHDKAPARFARAALQLAEEGRDFRLALCGPAHPDARQVFEPLRAALGERVVTFGGPEDRATYEGWLRRADLAVSCATHEFFGISMLEATHFGACPVVPDALAYPELFPPEYRYAEGHLVDALRARLDQWETGQPLRADRRALTRRFTTILPRYRDLFEALAAQGRRSARAG